MKSQLQNTLQQQLLKIVETFYKQQGIKFNKPQPIKSVKFFNHKRNPKSTSVYDLYVDFWSAPNKMTADSIITPTHVGISNFMSENRAILYGTLDNSKRNIVLAKFTLDKTFTSDIY